jgi:hypothetical protein
LNRAPLLGERRLNRRGWGFVDQRARLVGRPRRWPLELGRNRLRARGSRLGHIAADRLGLGNLRWMLDRGLRDHRWTRGGDRRSMPVCRNLRRRNWTRSRRWSHLCWSHLCRSDHLRLALLREGGAV